MRFRLTKDERGSVAVFASETILGLLLIAAIIFGVWAFVGRQDYKNNVDQKIAAATEVAKAEQKVADQKIFDEEEKDPYKTFTGPAEFGSISISYPKTWDVYADIKTTGGEGGYIEAYAYPDLVPAINNETLYSLRIQLRGQAFVDAVNSFEGRVNDGTVKSSPFRAAKVPEVLGVRLDGAIEDGKTGSMVILPVRNKTLRIWTEHNNFLVDFNKVIESLDFTP